MAASVGGGREGPAKLAVADQISKSVQSTSNIHHLMLQSSPSHSQLMKLPKNLLAKTSTINNTEMILHQMPRLISALDEHVANVFAKCASSEYCSPVTFQYAKLPA